jgi:hypothetical protein
MTGSMRMIIGEDECFKKFSDRIHMMNKNFPVNPVNPVEFFYSLLCDFAAPAIYPGISNLQDVWSIEYDELINDFFSIS